MAQPSEDILPGFTPELYEPNDRLFPLIQFAIFVLIGVPLSRLMDTSTGFTEWIVPLTVEIVLIYTVHELIHIIAGALLKSQPSYSFIFPRWKGPSSPTDWKVMVVILLTPLIVISALTLGLLLTNVPKILVYGAFLFNAMVSAADLYAVFTLFKAPPRTKVMIQDDPDSREGWTTWLYVPDEYADHDAG